MQIRNIYDNGGETVDRYTIVYDEYATSTPGEELLLCLGMDGDPFHPQGFRQHSSYQDGAHLGKEIGFFDLPVPCQLAVMADIGESIDF